MQFSIVIVSYNAVDHLQFCLESCEKAILHHDAEILVIDNHSPDRRIEDLQKLFPSVKFYFLDENLGFSKANNFGVDRAKGEFVLILNPDTIIPENLFDELIPFYKTTLQIGIVGVRLVDANGKFHPESKRNLPNVRNSFSKLFNFRKTATNSYYKEEVSVDETAPCSILVGAFMWMKKATFLGIGGFDERYFMYGEDIDLSYSCELHGKVNYYKGDQIVLHYKGESTPKDKRYYRIFFDAMKLFVAKYYGDNFFEKMLLLLGIRTKYFLSLLQHRRLKNVAKHPEKKALVWLEKDHDVQLTRGHYVLSTSEFSYLEILNFIATHHAEDRKFYIHSHRSQKIIGDEGVMIV